MSTIPPPGIYDISITAWVKHDTYYAASFQIYRGPHSGFSFHDRIPLVTYTRAEVLLRDNFVSLICTPSGTNTAHLVRRCVNGNKTLGIKKWGWR